ncbi:hypothetical protein A6F68_02138 [Tsuneonella dongtanensis]|uniref:DUF883 domain-containing protein n=1 Tax=Tsuneonella dongtanensis TaxID=692370 RepID=A0A1B2AER2_9SPHN|nr:hypothetical protein [Tsuneonella dongtanensis]ANY20640.1 hypothetical protein A6F68_02138 [Tsuneonella dongtanensis]
MTSTKRTELKQKIEAAEKRNAERSFGDYARDAADGATSLVKEHPVATVVGGLALGAIVASLLPGPGRKVRKKASARGAVIAGALADLALTYGTRFLDNAGSAARAGQDRVSDLGETLGDTARNAGKTASKTIGDLRSRFH